ncbi:hypothetical protein B0H16DRAFT_632633 [Mycena metata]|uniref:Uncharacterized protein n=1 Tax=Mycena metata TaxID=1033252 RepID=A0AAD7J819_9AGAR|nr:hypothetical protein B0H16DRAFT_632633 [Mycena metata]
MAMPRPRTRPASAQSHPHPLQFTPMLSALSVDRTCSFLLRGRLQSLLLGSPRPRLDKYAQQFWVCVLQSCVEACASHGISISTLLQEKSVEGHTPLYWAIIKRPRPSKAESAPDESLDLLTALLAFSTPLTPSTTSDVRLACLLMSDQELFRQLRAAPEFAPLSATDALLLDATSPPDDVIVEDLPSGADTGMGAFAVEFVLMRFQKRMNVSGAVSIEFIARGRMWRLGFHVAAYDRVGQPRISKGEWYASLSLLENSPPTWIDSRLLVAAPLESETKEELLVGARGIFSSGKARPRPTLSMRLKSHTQLRARRGGHGDEIVAPLDTEGGMGGLQYAGSSYISADETLHGRLEASLAVPQSDCIIC